MSSPSDARASILDAIRAEANPGDGLVLSVATDPDLPLLAILVNVVEREGLVRIVFVEVGGVPHAIDFEAFEVDEVFGWRARDTHGASWKIEPIAFEDQRDAARAYRRAFGAGAWIYDELEHLAAADA